MLLILFLKSRDLIRLTGFDAKYFIGLEGMIEYFYCVI